MVKEAKKEVRTRIYEVPATNVNGGDGSYLVEAVSQSAAWRHVAKKYIGKVELPNGKRIAELMGKGMTVETAAAEEE